MPSASRIVLWESVLVALCCGSRLAAGTDDDDDDDGDCLHQREKMSACL